MSNDKKLSHAELARLQHSMLKAALTEEPLAGASEPLRLPDLSFVLREGKLLLSAENLAHGIELNDLPVAVSIISPDDLQKHARTHGDVAYLRFAQPEQAGKSVRLALEGKILSGEARRQALGLSSVQVEFRKANGEWLATGEPTALAS